MRQIESMNNILNIVGRYNDFIIPLSQSGDAPIQFEVMQGQNIETPTDLMNKMEDEAVNSTGVPLEFVNSSLQQDFATRFTMSNTIFLKTVFTRQRKTKKFFSAIYTKLYDYEYKENYNYIEVELPPPLYLIATNLKQMFDLISTQADNYNDKLLYNKSDEVKQAFAAIHIKSQLAAYIDVDLIEREIKEAEMKVKADAEPATEDGEASGDETGGEDNGYGF